MSLAPTTPRGEDQTKDFRKSHAVTAALPQGFHGADHLAEARKQETINWDSQDTAAQVQKLQDAWQRTQIRSFTAWVNFQLRYEDIKVTDIAEDFSTGVVLAALLTVLAEEPVKINQKPRMRIHYMENVLKCLKFMQLKGMKLVNVSSEEIVDKNIKIILGTIWSLVRRFKIEGMQEDEAAGNDALLTWVQRKVKDYGIRVHNFHTSWQSGLALAAIIHSTYPNTLNYHKLPRNNPSAVLEECFTASEKNLDIPRMLEISDLVGIEKPDDHSVMTYISAHYEVQQHTKDWLNKFTEDLPTLKQRLHSAISKLGEPIRVNARDELVKLISQFADDCANTYNKVTEDYEHLQKITKSLSKMGLPVSEFEPSPFDEIIRLHSNMQKLIQQRKQDLSYADEFLKDAEAFLDAYVARLRELNSQLTIIEERLDKLPPDMTERLAILRADSDTLASQKRTTEELAHIKGRLEEKKVAFGDAPELKESNEKWENLTRRVKELLDALQLVEYKLKQYAKDAPTLNAWVDKVSLQLENLTAAADSVLDPGTTPNQDELRSLVDQYSILNAVYSHKKKDYAKLQELVESIRQVGLKETAYTNLSFEDRKRGLVGLKETAYTDLTFVELSEKWKTLDAKFRPVAAKMGIADEKINISEKCTKLVKELDDFIIQEDKLIKERAARKINDNSEFEALLAELDARPALIQEKQLILRDEDFVLEVPPETTAALSARLVQLLTRIAQEREELLKRKDDAEKYATRSRELDTWFNGSTESCTPADKPVNTVEEAAKEMENLDHYYHGQIAEHGRLRELAKSLNDKNFNEVIFGGVSLTVLDQHWTTLAQAYEQRKKFLSVAIEQLEISGNLEGVLARERKYLEASKTLQFQSKADYEQDAEGLKKHRQTVADCVTMVKKDAESNLETKATTLLADYDAEIARKTKLWESLQVYAKSAEEILLFITTTSEQISSESLQKLMITPNGNTQLETLINSINTEKIPPKSVQIVELENVVVQITKEGQKETVIFPHSFQEIQAKWKALLETNEAIKEHLPAFLKLVTILIDHAEKLKNIRTDKLDDKKSNVLKRYLSDLRTHQSEFEGFSSKPVLGNPTLQSFLNLIGDTESSIENWLAEEEKLDLWLTRAAHFESLVIAETDKVEEALAEVGRNLVAEYQHFLEEFWTLQTQYKDLGDAAEQLKAQDPTTRAESRYAEITEKWDMLQAALDRMKKRIQRGYTPEAEVLRAKAYIGELRGPKFVAPEVDRAPVDPAMDNNVVRIVLLGDPVGKTALISKFVKDHYPDVHVHTTSDVHTESIVEVGDKKFRLDILDTNSSEDMNSAVRTHWYTWADAFMFVYSMNNLKSFDAFYGIYTQMRARRGGRPYGLVLVANEADNQANREVPSLHGKSAALTMLCKYFEVSAKTGENVSLAFRELLKETALKKAVSDRMERERLTDQQKMMKSKSKNKSKGDINTVTTTKENKSLTADANIDWRVVRLNQLMVLYELQKDVSNRFCADCGRENPDWVAMGFMVLLCVQCAHIHKMHILNPRIPKPRNLLMESLSQKEVKEVTALCNGRANMVLERVVPTNKVKPKPEDPRDAKVAWIKAKYIAHEFYLSMNNEINNKAFQFQNHLSKKFARDKIITYRTPNDKVPAVRITGPKANTGNEVVKGDFFAASSISTFPVGDVDESDVDGGDIVDRWGLEMGKNHLFACVADGCGWGKAPGKSARNATDEFLAFVDLNFNKINTVEEASSLLQNSVLIAHDSTTKDLDAKSVINYWEVGTTAFLGGMILYEKKEQGFVCVSVGNCKAYVVKFGGKGTKGGAAKVTDITAGSRDYTLHEDDPGGCIGPQQEAGAPDLRNLQIFYSPVDVGDVVILMTDGVYQNYDPEYLGIAPKDIGETKYPQASWSELKPRKVNKLKDRHICSMIERTLEKAGARTPAQIEQTLLEHARLVTIPRRAFMEREGKTPPPSYVSYPGRLDHTTVACFVVQREYPNFNA